MSGGKFRAWTEAMHGQDGVRAAYVGVPPDSVDPLEREPAERLFSTIDEARSWVEDEARAVGVVVEWNDDAPRSSFASSADEPERTV